MRDHSEQQLVLLLHNTQGWCHDYYMMYLTACEPSEIHSLSHRLVSECHTWCVSGQHIARLHYDKSTKSIDTVHKTKQRSRGMPNRLTHTGSPMALYRRKISFMKSTFLSRLRWPNAFSNKQNSSSSEITVCTIFQHFLNSFELTFAVVKALAIWNSPTVPWLLHHLCLIRAGTFMLLRLQTFVGSWIYVT